ncbi:PREDICTED: (DUF1262) [Prunus dulcis]|uniref:PREDICTED: (DUF1262) n=1 Tax=Prunus dulcis TaxID=3755 RepID=A0A5E4G6B8_PRUDU|nr:PREDICTED: (DUF1262) [Prunus dulcis]
MYVTRPLSMYRRSPESLSLPPPEGPNSGYLVLHDEESDEVSCCGCIDNRVRDTPFPQNEDLTVGYGSDNDPVAFIPVLDQPLSSNRYQVIHRRGRHKGEASTNSREEDMGTGLFNRRYVRDVNPKPLDPSDIYQQVEILTGDNYYKGSFTAKSVAPDGFPPKLLRTKGWIVTRSTPYDYQLGEAPGLNSSLRASLPGFDFPLSHDCSEAVFVGKWYCPFMFVKEGGVRLKEQMKKCMFYEILLEQRWEKIFDSVNENVEGKNKGAVFVDAFAQREVVFVGGSEAIWDERNVSGDGFMWFKSFDGVGGETSVGLSMKVVERMKWEQERVGWVGGDERQVRVERVEEFGGTGGMWKRFGCHVLVERFVLKRMSVNGSFALLTYDFKHTHQIRSKWE